MKSIQRILFSIFILTLSQNVMAVPSLINFSGQLQNDDGPVDSPTNVVFRLFSQETGGAAVFSENQTITPDENGIYHVLIGQNASLVSVDFNFDLWLDIEVAGERLSPRFRLASAPYALRASTANAVNWSGIIGIPAGIADGSDDAGVVVSTNILAGSITNVDISNTAGIELSKLDRDPSLLGTINLATNPVDWSQLKNVPADFADGSDDMMPGVNSVGGFQIIDGTITVGDLADNAVTSAKILAGEVSLTDLNVADVDTRYTTLGTDQTLTGEKSFNQINANAVRASSLTVSGPIAVEVEVFTAVNGVNNNIDIGNASFVRVFGPSVV